MPAMAPIAWDWLLFDVFYIMDGGESATFKRARTE